MKKGVVVFLFALFLAGSGLVPAASGGDDRNSEKIKDCKVKGIPLQGKVRFVRNFGDIKIRVVDTFSDLKVKVRENFTNSCGEWQIVDHFPDFTVEIVDTLPDIEVKFVEYFPGVEE
ncbi:MAG: hypothetical protein HYW47_02235 [Deltaproteobacteria bacterium]|nr:hypothetical protein [Deltaproteobacteria bacterium]